MQPSMIYIMDWKCLQIFYWINDDIHDAVHQRECLESLEWGAFYHPSCVGSAGSSCGWWHKQTPAEWPAPSTWSRPRPARRRVMAREHSPGVEMGQDSSPSLWHHFIRYINRQKKIILVFVKCYLKKKAFRKTTYVCCTHIQDITNEDIFHMFLHSLNSLQKLCLQVYVNTWLCRFGQMHKWKK